MPYPPQHELDHEREWDEQLLDWVDGIAEDDAAAVIERHVRECACCQRRVGEFRELDRLLRAGALPVALDAGFDRRVLAQLPPLDEPRRPAADLEQRTPAERWRRKLRLIMP